jgi:hypothetical protein
LPPLKALSFTDSYELCSGVKVPKLLHWLRIVVSSR